MAENQDATNKLLEKLELLLEKQEAFTRDVNELRSEITQLNSPQPKEKPITKGEPKTLLDFKTKAEEEGEKAKPHIISHPPKQQINRPPFGTSSQVKTDLERFIGENLISKIGIAITVFGIAIGAKYSIDNDLISPLVRIILGYMLGFILLGVGLKLKAKYQNYSAVLVSGAMAIMYFMTYAGYSFYSLFPQIFAFILMLLLTVATTYIATKYDKQVIALFGLVGAYAIPFVLSDDSGNTLVLFSYIFIINCGILVLSFKKDWKQLYHSSFFLTWLIYTVWHVDQYEMSEHFGLALTFLSLFFATFYIAALAYKLLHKQKFAIDDIFLLSLNSFIFYGFGYVILEDHSVGEELVGLFTLGNAIVHGLISLMIFKQKSADRNFFYFVFGLALVFLTITIPIQFDGNWVTLLWVGEAAVLFWIGRTKNVPMYERLSYPLLFLSFFSLVHDWITFYDMYDADLGVTPLLNIQFFSSLLFMAAFGFINWLHLNKNYTSPFTDQKGILKLISFSIPTILLLTIYFSFRMEIVSYWDQLYMVATNEEYQPWYNDFRKFKAIWLINYSLFFLAILSFVNIRKVQDRTLGLINLGFNVLVIWLFLTDGLHSLSQLRESYLSESADQVSVFYLVIRYISFAFVALLLTVCYTYVKEAFLRNKFNIAFDGVLHVTILWVLSNEFIHWMDIASSTQSDKLGLSILWGVYALTLIVIGIWKKRKHLRIGAFSLFGVTLLKLFFYDVSHLDTISKTILFVSLGILLLIISFLYNKFKDKIE